MIMSIASMTFLFVFLPMALALYYVVNSGAKEFVLLMLSVVFYAIGSIKYIVLFSVAVFLTVLIGRGIDNCKDKSLVKKSLLFVGIIINLTILIYYKYVDLEITKRGRLIVTDVQIRDIALPLGISFFTFKSISYLVDVYKHSVVLSKNPIKDALYLSFFAQVQSGPLSRYKDMTLENQLRFDFDLFSDGVCRFMAGFSKKILIANVLAIITKEVFDTPLWSFSTSYAWLGSICYSLQIFFDFSGYSDMAIGITEMFGYKCPENFNYPYTTDSVSRFWRRWHITLSEWFRDYVYIPLGGSHNKKKWKTYCNLFIVWILTGVWHGATLNFIVWGLGYFIVISMEKIYDLPNRIKSKGWKILYRIFVLLFINFQWVLFNSRSLGYGLRYIKRMILPYRNDLSNVRTLFLLKDYVFFILVAIVLSTPIIPRIANKLDGRPVAKMIYEVLIVVIIIFAFVWSISFIVAGQNNPFVYANF